MNASLYALTMTGFSLGGTRVANFSMTDSPAAALPALTFYVKSHSVVAHRGKLLTVGNYPKQWPWNIGLFGWPGWKRCPSQFKLAAFWIHFERIFGTCSYQLYAPIQICAVFGALDGHFRILLKPICDIYLLCIHINMFRGPLPLFAVQPLLPTASQPLLL